jgi:predicted ribosome quality control (RQC) complex YloA/Tae2 family protein
MANMHQIKTGSEKITLNNFYNNDHPLEIKLKKDLNPQKNAEIFYKKSKNQKIEAEHLQQALQQKKKEIDITESQLQSVQLVNDLKALRQFKTEAGLDHSQSKTQVASLPYHEFIHNGYRIWVGRNAQSNDTLTLKFGYKEDLWLHAKDVAGSHVLIKHQAGKNFPKDVIERAAQLAAYNSKRKNESLCPVIVTPKKFVRKRKGDPAGAVVVEKEDVIMVEPKL